MRLLWSQGAASSFREEDFFGRDEEMTQLLRVCLEGKSGIGASVLLFGPPNVGKTSLLLKTKTALLSLPEGSTPPRPFPFYFSFSKILSHPLALSHHFLQEYLWQLLSFHGETPRAAFDTEALGEELSHLGFPESRELVADHRKYVDAGDGLSALANALSFPFSMTGRDFYPVFLLDDFQYTLKLQNIPEGAIVSILRPYIKAGHYPIVVSGSSPGHVTSTLKREGLYGSFQLMEIGGLSAEASLRMWGPLFDRRRIRMPDRLLDRASARLGRIPIYQRMFVEDLSYRNVSIGDEVAFENFYALSVTEGKINRYWREFFENIFPQRPRRARAVKFLKRVLCDRFPIDSFEGALSLMGTSAEEGGEILAALEFKGLLKSDLDHIRFVADPVLADFLFWAYERGVQGTSPSQVASGIVQSKLSWAVPESGEGEEEKRAETVKALMRRWDGREIPAVLFDFSRFRERYGGKGLLEVVIGIQEEVEKVRLPQISSVSTGYRSRRGRTRFDFDLVAYGFSGPEFSEENLVIWAADVSLDKTLLPAAVEHFENRCRLLSLDKGLRDDQLRKWILFDGAADPAALALAGSHGIRLTQRSQLKLFLNLFGLEEIERVAPPAPPPEKAPGDKPLEFELVLPVKTDTEVVAARVAEEVAACGSIDKDTVDRIKMAIIEACINAFEHSGSESGKVRLRYVLSPDRIEIQVRDDGKGFRPGEKGKEPSRNRGWGLKMIRELVDDVEVETGDAGTTVRMVIRLDGPSGGEEAPPPAPEG